MPPRIVGGQRTVDAHHRAAVAVTQRDELLEQPAGQAAHARLNGVDADVREMAQPDLDGRNGEVVQRAVLEAGFARRQDVRLPWTVAKLTVPPANHGRCETRPAPSFARSAGSRRRSGSRTSCRTTIVTKSGWTRREIEAVGRHERRGVEQHVPALRPRAASISSSGCFTPEKLDCAGNANRLRAIGVGRRPGSASSAPSSMRSSGNVSGDVVDCGRHAGARTHGCR